MASIFKRLQYAAKAGLITFQGNSKYFFNSASESLPNWLSLDNRGHYQHQYENNPVISSIIDIKSDAMANMIILVEDSKTGEVIPHGSTNQKAEKLYQLMAQPNPLMSTFEFMKLFQVMIDVFGEGFMYALVPAGFENRWTFMDVDALWVLYSQYVNIKPTGNLFFQTDVNKIIDYYRFSKSGYTHDFKPSEIFHRNDVNISLGSNPLGGTSRMKALRMPISNIQAIYESRNVLIRKRGALGFYSSAARDSAGSIPLTPLQKTDAEEAFSNYGTLEDQKQFIITTAPLSYQNTSMTPKQLMLLEDLATDTKICSHKYGVPDILTKLNLIGDTFENQEASVRRLYQETTIPNVKDMFIGLNTFLKTEVHNLRLRPSYDHVQSLQENKKEQSSRRVQDNVVGESLFRASAITLNVWLEMVGIPPIVKGDRFVTQLTPEELSIFLEQPITESNPED